MTAFADRWIADWNAHDLEAILSHYAPEVIFHSPKVAVYTRGAKTHFTSREELRPYFSRAFAMWPNLHFDLKSVCTDANGVALFYANEVGAAAVEIMELDDNGHVKFARVLYDR
jgi:hypothetical protein